MIANPYDIPVASYERLAAMIERIADVAELSRDGWATSHGEFNGWLANADGFRWSEDDTTQPWMDADNAWDEEILCAWEGDDWIPNAPMSALEKLAREAE